MAATSSGFRHAWHAGHAAPALERGNVSVVQFGTHLDSRTTTSKTCEAVPSMARRLLYHSSLGSRVIKKRKREKAGGQVMRPPLALKPP